jgi:hypothetical protein
MVVGSAWSLYPHGDHRVVTRTHVVVKEHGCQNCTEADALLSYLVTTRFAWRLRLGRPTYLEITVWSPDLRGAHRRAVGSFWSRF